MAEQKSQMQARRAVILSPACKARVSKVKFTQAPKGRKNTETHNLNCTTMPQSLVKNCLHLIFSTKHRVHLLDEEIQPEMFRYIGGILKQLDCVPAQVGGYNNHIHALFLLNKNLSLVKVVEEAKSHSSRWVKTKGEAYRNFYWQNGYGAFSVNPSEIDKVIAYIMNQKEHHRKVSFEDECRAFLKKYGVEYDERYVWD